MRIARILCICASVGFVYAQSEERGELRNVDTFSLPHALRSQVEARVAPYRNTPFSSDLMMRLRADIAAIDSKIIQNWIQDSQNSYSVSFSYPPEERRNHGLLSRIDTSRLPERLRSQVEARVSSFLNAPFSESLVSTVQSAVGLIDPKISFRWSHEPVGNTAVTLLYDGPAEDPQPVQGVLDRIDVSQVPEPWRTRLEQRLAKYRNAPYTSALMREIAREASAAAPKFAMRWQVDRPGVFSLTFTDEPAPSPQTTPRISMRAEEGFPSGGEKQIRVGAVVQEKKLKRSVAPVYPPVALQARIQGTVRFDAQIGTDGRVKRVSVISGHPLLVPAATDAVQQYEYDPTLLNGEPVQVLTQIEVPFTLKQE